MLVASLALSPLASFGVVKAEAADVEYSVAEYSSVDTLISRLNSVYDQLTTTDREALQAARDNLNNLEKFPKESWAVYAEKISKNKDENTAEKADLLKALIDLTTFSTNTETLKRSIDTFKLNQSTNINTVFGSDVTVDMVLNFIAEVESDYVESLRGIDIDTLNETTLVLKFVTSMNNVNEDNTSVNNADNAKVFQRLQHAVNLYQVPAVLAEISGKIDPAPRFVARKAFINALQKVQPVTPPSGGGGGGVTPPVTPPAEPTLPEKATVVVKEQNASGTVEVVTKVSTEKVNEIANLVTAKNSVVPLKLEKPAAGEEVKAQVPAALFTEMGKKNANAVVKVETEEASYKLPASEINVADLAKKLGVSASDVQITVSVNVVKAEDVKDNVDNNNLNPVSNIIEFTVKAVSGDKEESVSKFSVYVEREIVGKINFKANQSTAVRLNDNGTFSAIPTVFDGKTATIKSLTNSKYTIVENDKTFTDVNNGKNFAESIVLKS